MRWNSFPRSLLFAAAAAVLAVPVVLLGSLLFGERVAIAFTAVAAVSAYVAGMGGSARRGLGVGALASLLAGGVALTAQRVRHARNARMKRQERRLSLSLKWKSLN